MPRYKQTARRPKPATYEYIDANTLFPLGLLDIFLSSSAVGQNRPAKRLKTIGSQCAAFRVGHGSVRFSRPFHDDDPADSSEEYSQAQEFVSLNHMSRPTDWRPDEVWHLGRAELTPGSGLQDVLCIMPQSGLPASSTSTYYISVSAEDISPGTWRALRLAGSKPYDPSPGAIWGRAKVTLSKSTGSMTMILDYDLFWNETPSPLNGLRQNTHREPTDALINTFFPPPAQEKALSPLDFYESAFVPRQDESSAAAIEVPGLDSTLFPYQKRTLVWLLGREGVRWSGGSTTSVMNASSAPLSDTSRVVKDLDGKRMFLNDVFHTVCSSNEPFRQVELAAKGGILAEEMGLGKTLEVLALILLHTRSESEAQATQPTADGKTALLRSGATLIVTPEPLRQQWLSEVTRHAPGLRFIYYQGCKREGWEGDEAVKRLSEYDIVITTYSVLSAELHFAEKGSERSRRREPKYERPKSPLIQISWWRLCLDEAQMVENSMTQASKLCRLIPRINSWAITGTPVKDDVHDLIGLLMFMGYEPLSSAPHLWRAVLDRKCSFQGLFNTLAIRHTKAMVRDEISVPPQHRYVISVPFTAVEEQHYQSLVQEMAEECGLDVQGNPIDPDWSSEKFEESMRMWLNRLRQTALHPEIGVYARRRLGQGRERRPMRTVDEVLGVMLEQSEIATRTDERALLSAKLTRGQLLENSPRVREALEIWQRVKNEVEKMVANARLELTAALNEAKAKGKAEQIDSAGSGSEDEDEGDEEGDDSKGRVGEYRRRLRFDLELQHKSVFFCANAFFQIRDNKDLTEPESEEFEALKKSEDNHYEEAKILRREILSGSHRKATRLMGKISRQAAEQSFVVIPELAIKNERGLQSGRLIDDLEALYLELNEQANMIDELREAAIQLLLEPLLDEEDGMETTGEELMDSAKIQDELMVYVQVIRAAIADRQDAMSGQENELVKHETKISLRQARDGEGPAPTKMLELMELRARLRPQTTDVSMRGALSLLRSLVSRLNTEEKTQRTVVEHAIAMKHLHATQAALQAQSKIITTLNSEVEGFTATMNARLDYYRHLQNVSDSVLPLEGPKTEEALEKLVKTEQGLQRKLATGQSKHRYLIHLKETGSNTSEARMCVICQQSFETGVLTICGHQFCKECMVQWYKAHRNCPVCKRLLKASDLHDIVIRPQELRIHSGEPGHSQQDGHTIPTVEEGKRESAKQTAIYSAFNADKLAEIKDIELDGLSYTSKVDTLVRHILWLRESDPGAKSIVFSQYKDFLGILANAFQRFRIGFASVDSHGGTTRFKEDAAAEVFLLHARAHSSGLNLVNASHVFLCEPLVNTAIELQAIARVDRIGQQHETTVWLYITAGTVEESIYNLSVKRRMQHMNSNQDLRKGKSLESTPELMDASLDAANTLEMEQAALSKLMSRDKTAGEVVDKGDLWECLFGHIKTGSE